MRKRILTSLFAVGLLGGFITADAASPLASGVTQTSRTQVNDRYLNAFTLTARSTSAVYSPSQGSALTSLYFDLTESATPLKTIAGAQISIVNVDAMEGWTSGYLYIDYNKDNSIDPTTNAYGTNSGELVSCAFDHRTNKNSLGVTAANAGSGLVKNMPSFTLPQNLAVGTYTARFKVDFDGYAELPNGSSIISTAGGTIVDFLIEIVPPEVVRTVSVESADETMGTVSIQGTTETSVTQSGAVVAVATPKGGYRFVNWTNGAADGTVVSDLATYPYVDDEAITLVANFEEVTYPVMKVLVTGAANQNRYLKSVTVSPVEGSDANFLTEGDGRTIFDLGSKMTDHIVRTYGTATTDSACYDKTNRPIHVGMTTHGANENNVDATSVDASFNMTFIPWLDTEQVSGAVQLQWTQQAYYIDWNKNGKFTDAGEASEPVVKGSSSSNDNFIVATGYTRQITIPAGTPLGMYRMRVVYYDQGATPDTWVSTLFTTLDNTTKNGYSYDFLLDVADMQALQTSVDAVDAQEAAKVIAGTGEINVIGTADDIKVYTAGGVLVSSNRATVNCAAGLYIVRVDGKATKVIVK